MEPETQASGSVRRPEPTQEEKLQERNLDVAYLQGYRDSMHHMVTLFLAAFIAFIIARKYGLGT